MFSIRFECTTIEEISDLAEQLEATLQKSSKDANLKISHFKKGSVIIVIEGTRDAYKVLKSLFKAGQLTTLLGKQIIDIMIEYEPDSRESLSPTLNFIRKFISNAIRTNEDLGSFCLDYFKENVFREFTRGMSTTMRINYLLKRVAPEEILNTIIRNYPVLFEKHKNELAFEIKETQRKVPVAQACR